jgi:RNA polymerase sigma factor (sigma-70 family)
MYASTTEQSRRAKVQAIAERLYRQRYPYLLRIAVKNAANEADAEEALQDAFVSFIDHFDPSGEAPPLAWLTLTLKRRCWALCARQRRGSGREHNSQSALRAEAIADPRRQPDEIVEVSERVERVRAGIAELKPAERRALSLLAAGYSYQEIATMNHWTYTKVNRCAAEGRARLREQAA